METQTVAALTETQLNAVGVTAIIAKAAILARDPDWPKWRVYEAAKAAIKGSFYLTPGEYEEAIKHLAEALKV